MKASSMVCADATLPSPGNKVAVQGASADTSRSAEGRLVVESAGSIFGLGKSVAGLLRTTMKGRRIETAAT
jgi:hypothetical protein